MPFDVVMPQLGLTMTEGAVNRWFKQNGDPVEKGEMLFEVSTDKVEMEVEAVHSGRLQIVLEPGATVPVGAVIGYLLQAGEQPVSTGSSPAPRPAEPAGSAPETAAAPAPRDPGDAVAISPRARALARRLGVDLSTVTPARPGARIVEADVQRAKDRLRDAGA